MRMSIRWKFIGIVGAFACALLAIAPGTSALVTEGENQGPDARDRDADAILVDLASGIAGFGGMWVDSDDITGEVVRLHVWLVDTATTDAGAARTLASEFVGDDIGDVPVVFHTGSFSFAQLKTWHDALSPAVLALPDVTFTDIDERHNRLLIGLDHSSAEPPARDLAAALGIPVDAVVFETSAPMRPLLRDKNRPLRGGFQIQFQTGFLGTGTGTCTLGFIAVRSGTTGFVTNSHCSRTRSSVDNGRYWQATRPITDQDQVGTEIADPSFFTGGACPVNKRCRKSDSNFVDTSVNTARGTVARIPTSTTDWNGVDLYRITSTGGVLIGDVVTKVGRTSGLSSGKVTHTCSNGVLADSDIVVLCEARVDGAESDPGDSGSPVFRVTNNPNTNDVRLVGILWGESADPALTLMVYSPFTDVEAELGNLNVCAGGFTC